MPIRSDCISRPVNPTPRTFAPPHTIGHRIRDGETWESLARRFGMDAWGLIRLNYPTLPADRQAAAREINWYLQEYVGCQELTKDGKNYVFSSKASPGIIYVPAAGAGPAPLLETIAERRQSILHVTPGRIRIEPNDEAKAYPKPWYALPGLEEMTVNTVNIERMASLYNLDADFIRAVIWMESTHGWYDRYIREQKSIRPMNVHANLWAQLGVTRAALADPEVNIEAGVRILAAIWERTEEPTFEKVATLYNALGADSVSGYGKTIVHYMKHKPWLGK